MYVLTVDQRGSRTDRDRVPDIIDRYATAHTVRPFDRTAGDEVQAVFDAADEITAIAVDLAATDNWSVGIGVGTVDLPLPAATRAGRGRAFEAAREAVEAAKRDRRRIRVVGSSDWTVHAQTAAGLLVDVLANRSEAGREAVALMRTGITQATAADRLGITPQAMSSRLATAGWDLQIPAEALLARLLTEADAR
ncbi:hypothetical protein L5G28_10740 [Gordonia sp. HY285]|uniref:hypothetical protein n=1 Tax=Gordonia liuliyuniae TaxID=2911517 RepID=UPI001F44F6E0|nr:hypothetical protein [Gordonia liuliyuniae]MCF8610627.1 hypothetical protein [Gordonia liuliyuniae]